MPRLARVVVMPRLARVVVMARRGTEGMGDGDGGFETCQEIRSRGLRRTALTGGPRERGQRGGSALRVRAGEAHGGGEVRDEEKAGLIRLRRAAGRQAGHGVQCGAEARRHMDAGAGQGQRPRAKRMGTRTGAETTASVSPAMPSVTV